ncbi:MAG: HAD-IA family hydrolase [Dehalococcoidia bacterium]|nr:HAD-IA family hydrolase [Dehalococcoidia bacterium]
MLKAVIFDMDGVLTDTEPVHFRATNVVLATVGRAMTWEQYAPFIGRAEPEMWDYMRDHFGLDNSENAQGNAYSRAVLELLEEGTEAIPGAQRAVLSAKEAGLLTAVASSSRESWVLATLRGAGLLGEFDAIVAGDMVKRGKPDPEIFLAAAGMLMVQPSACLVVEDSPHGIAAAAAAGMFAIGVRSRFELDLAAADDVIDSIADFRARDYLPQP